MSSRKATRPATVITGKPTAVSEQLGGTLDTAHTPTPSNPQAGSTVLALPGRGWGGLIAPVLGNHRRPQAGSALLCRPRGGLRSTIMNFDAATHLQKFSRSEDE
jgi:hypothetical protein